MPKRKLVFVACGLIACSEANPPQSDEDSAPLAGQGGDGEGNAAGAAGGAGGEDSNEGGHAGQALGGQAGVTKPDAGSSTESPDAAKPTDARPDAASTSAKPRYACSQFLGPNVTGEWFAAGFETHVDGGRWQVKAPHRSFVEDWANAGHAVWKESGCEGTFYNCETKSKCADGAKPDRILFVTQTGNYLGTSQQKWQELIASAISTIKIKYPGLKNIELMTFVRGPQNSNCGNETTVSMNLDKAQQAVAASSNGFVTVSPRFEVARCNMFSGPPHLSTEGNRFVAELIGKHYAASELP